MPKHLKIVVLSAFLLAGCAGVSRQDMLQETEGFELPASPKAGKAMIYVVRPSGTGALIRFNVFVADPNVESQEAGYTRGGQNIYFETGAGDQTLYSVAENTATLNISLAADSSYFVLQEAQMGFVMARNKLKLLDPVVGRYYLKKTKPGNIKRSIFP